MPAEVVTAVYKPKPGKDAALRALIQQHGPALAGSGLCTSRPRLVLRSSTGIYVEVFEWKDGGASAHAAHTHPVIGPIWAAMGEVCDFSCLAELAESTAHFPHFVAQEL